MGRIRYGVDREYDAGFRSASSRTKAFARFLFFQSDEPCEVSYKDRKGKYQAQKKIETESSGENFWTAQIQGREVISPLGELGLRPEFAYQIASPPSTWMTWPVM